MSTRRSNHARLLDTGGQAARAAPLAGVGNRPTLCDCAIADESGRGVSNSAVDRQASVYHDLLTRQVSGRF